MPFPRGTFRHAGPLRGLVFGRARGILAVGARHPARAARGALDHDLARRGRRDVSGAVRFGRREGRRYEERPIRLRDGSGQEGRRSHSSSRKPSAARTSRPARLTFSWIVYGLRDHGVAEGTSSATLSKSPHPPMRRLVPQPPQRRGSSIPSDSIAWCVCEGSARQTI